MNKNILSFFLIICEYFLTNRSIYCEVLNSWIVLVIAMCHAGVGGRTGGQSGLRGVGVAPQRSRSPYELRGLGNEHSYMHSSSNTKSKDYAAQRSGRNISTLQIVFILTLIMSLGFAGYYFIQFYPFICSKESKYDVMDRTSVTPTQSSREFEYESTSSATKSTNASYSNEHDVWRLPGSQKICAHYREFKKTFILRNHLEFCGILKLILQTSQRNFIGAFQSKS